MKAGSLISYFEDTDSQGCVCQSKVGAHRCMCVCVGG